MSDKGIKNFRTVVGRAIVEMGSAPYDDRKTEEALRAATRRTVEWHEKQKAKEKLSTEAKPKNDTESQ